MCFWVILFIICSFFKNLNSVIHPMLDKSLLIDWKMRSQECEHHNVKKLCKKMYCIISQGCDNITACFIFLQPNWLLMSGIYASINQKLQWAMFILIEWQGNSHFHTGISLSLMIGMNLACRKFDGQNPKRPMSGVSRLHKHQKRCNYWKPTWFKLLLKVYMTFLPFNDLFGCNSLDNDVKYGL